MAPDIVTAGMLRAIRTTTIPPRTPAAPSAVRPEKGTDKPASSASDPTALATTPRTAHVVMTLLGFSANQPCPTTCASRARSKAATFSPNLGTSSGSIYEPSELPPIARRSRNASSSAGPIGRRAFRARWASSSAPARPGTTSIPTFLPMPSRPLSWWNEIRPRLARSSIAVVNARRDVPPSITTAPAAAVSSGGGAGISTDGSSR